MAEEAVVTPDLKLAFNALSGKKALYDTLMQYAEGDQPIVYSTERLRTAFANINARFSQNWCSVIVDSVNDRLVLQGWDAGDEEKNEVLATIWSDQHLTIESDDAHWSALVTHESFIIVWPNEEAEPEVYYNDPRLCHIFYENANPRKKRFAAKWFIDDDGFCKLILYYKDRIEYYKSSNTGTPSTYEGFRSDNPASATNPYDTIPVFHLRVKSRSTAGELTNVITLQDAVNKLFADMMVAAEYGAFKQRWIISNSETSDLRNAPNSVWEIPAGDGLGQATSVGQFEAADLSGFLTAMDKLANSMAIISRTPKHYFYSTGSQISGEALIAMEAPLNKKAKTRQESFGVVWKEIAVFIFKIRGEEISEQDIIPIWGSIENVQPLTQAQSRQLGVQVGIPLLTLLKREGWTKRDLEQLSKDLEEEQQREQNVPNEWYVDDTAGNKGGDPRSTATANGRPAGPNKLDNRS